MTILNLYDLTSLFLLLNAPYLPNLEYFGTQFSEVFYHNLFLGDPIQFHVYQQYTNSQIYVFSQYLYSALQTY